MGLTYVDGTVRGPQGVQEHVRFLVDSGAAYTLLPHNVWTRIGPERRRSLSLVLADDTEVRRSVSECYIVLEHGEAHTPVILGEPGDEPLLGVVTLEVLGLVLHPFARRLQPMRMMLA